MDCSSSVLSILFCRSLFFASIITTPTISSLLHYLSYHRHDQLVETKTNHRKINQVPVVEPGPRGQGKLAHRATTTTTSPHPRHCSGLQHNGKFTSVGCLARANNCQLVQSGSASCTHTHTHPAKQSLRTCYKCVY